MFNRLPLRTKLIAAVAIPILAFIPLALIAVSTFRAVQINGAEYDEIIEAEDIVADVLPPPHYLIETYLTAREVVSVQDPAEKQELLVRLDQLEAEFEERHQYWLSGELSEEPVLSEALNGAAYDSGLALITAIETQLIPILDQDHATQEAVLDDVIRPAYLTHRAAVDEVVALGLERQVELEAEASDLVSSRFTLLIGAAVALVVGVGIIASVLTRSIRRPLDRLREQAERTASEWLPAAVAQVQSGVEVAIPPVELPEAQDEIYSLAKSFAGVQDTALRLATEQAAMRASVTNSFVQLGRRNHGLLGRSLEQLSKLESDERDPERLNALYKVDHLTTRMRRNAESLLVLADNPPLRTWSKPVSVLDVVRSAISEIEAFDRVSVANLEAATVRGTAVADISHLLAELLENGAAFSPPGTEVQVYGRMLSNGYQIAVVDSGIGMTDEQLAAANERVAESGSVSDASLATMGLHVVGRLAARHGILMRFTRSPREGVVATVVLPTSVLGETDLVEAPNLPRPTAPATADPGVLAEASQPDTERRVAVMSRLQAMAEPSAERAEPVAPQVPTTVGAALPSRASAPAAPADDEHQAAAAAPVYDASAIGSALGSFQQGHDAARKANS